MFHDDPSSFGRRLRSIRKSHGCESPEKLKNLLGGDYSVSSILKRERGEIKLDRSYLERFCSALKISAPERKKLFAVLDIFLVQFDPWRRFKESGSQLHFEYWERVRSASIYRQYEPLYLCAFLQIEQYTYEALRALGIDHAMASESAKLRWAMGQELLEGSSRIDRRLPGRAKRLPQIVFIQDEEALYRPIGSERLMCEQINYLKEIKLPERVKLLFLPRQSLVRAPLGYNFNIYDDLMANMETICGNVFVTDPDTIALLNVFFRHIQEASYPHSKAKKMLDRAISSYSN